MSTPFISSQSLGTLRNNFTGRLGFVFMPGGCKLTTTLRNNFAGRVGFKFTVGGANISVTHLGRMMISGNSGTHTLVIYDWTAAGDIGSVSVNMSGGTVGQFVYGALGSPVTLVAGQSYSIESTEASGGDQWYDGGVAVNYDTSIGTINSGVFSDTSTSGAAGTMFGPVSFKFASGSELIKQNDVSVDSIGRWVISGNSQTHDLKIYDWQAASLIASVTVNCSGATVGQYLYGSITPVTLHAGRSYSIESTEASGGDQFYNNDTTVTYDQTFAAGIGWVLGSVFSDNSGGTDGKTYVPTNFTTAPPEVDESITLAASAGITFAETVQVHAAVTLGLSVDSAFQAKVSALNAITLGVSSGITPANTAAMLDAIALATSLDFTKTTSTAVLADTTLGAVLDLSIRRFQDADLTIGVSMGLALVEGLGNITPGTFRPATSVGTPGTFRPISQAGTPGRFRPASGSGATPGRFKPTK